MAACEFDFALLDLENVCERVVPKGDECGESHEVEMDDAKDIGREVRRGSVR